MCLEPASYWTIIATQYTVLCLNIQLATGVPCWIGGMHGKVGWRGQWHNRDRRVFYTCGILRFCSGTAIPAPLAVVVVSEPSWLDVATTIPAVDDNSKFNTSWTNVAMSCLLKDSSQFSDLTPVFSQWFEWHFFSASVLIFCIRNRYLHQDLFFFFGWWPIGFTSAVSLFTSTVTRE